MECVRLMFFSPVLKILSRAKTVEISPRKRQVQKISSAGGATINYVPSEPTIRTQRIVCLKKYIENYYLKDTEINSFFIAILTLPTCLNPFQSFYHDIGRVLKLGLQSLRNNHLAFSTFSCPTNELQSSHFSIYNLTFE